MIRGSARLPNPDDTLMELTISAPVGEWKKIADQMTTEWPSWQVASVIREAMRKLLTQVNATEKVES